MSFGHHSAAPTGLGEGRGVVLMMAGAFSDSTCRRDNMGAAGTYQCWLPMLAFILPKPVALSTCCSGSPGFSGLLPLFVTDLRERRGSVTLCQVRWLIIITGGVQTLADKSLQGLM